MKPTSNIGEREREWLLREKYGGAESEAFRADCARLENGEPLDYVIGFSNFLGCTIDLSFRPLIPRAETEHWLARALEKIEAERGREAPLRILDIFAGSGCIGIAALSRLPNAQADFADISTAATEQIEKNLFLNAIAGERTRIYTSDVWDGIPAGTKYDVVFANPPYIADRARPDRSVLEHEPHLALFAEEHGLALIRRVLARAKDFLVPGGMMYIEHDHDQKEGIEALLSEYGFTHYSFQRDQFGLLRLLAVTM